MLPDVFNAKDNEKMGGFDPIPAGWYLVEITKSEMKDTSAGTGRYLTCQLKVLEGEYEGRYLFNLMNLVNPNSTAVEIAQKELASMCEACELDEIEDSTELHGIPMAVRVVIKPESGGYPPKNEIKAYKPGDEMPEVEEGEDNPFEK
jgi:hypothetical protein